jgi:mannose-1-phosphate guanylyltransferase
MVLCAGFGERMRPLSEELPKPLLPIGDRPVLAHIAQQLSRAGYRSAVANTHWLSDKFAPYIEDLELALTLIHEPRIRGVAGAVAGARALLEAPVIVWNGDILISAPPLAELAARVQASGQLCLAVAPAAGAGTVGLDAQDRMVRVRGERFGDEVRQADYVGLFAVGDGALRELPEEGCLIGDYCLPRLRRGEQVDTLWMASPWREVGSLRGYLEANRHWLSHHANLDGHSYVHPSARVSAGVRVAASVVGAHAEVDGAGSLDGCVVWPAARARVPLASAVVTPRAVAKL